MCFLRFTCKRRFSLNRIKRLRLRNETLHDKWDRKLIFKTLFLVMSGVQIFKLCMEILFHALATNTAEPSDSMSDLCSHSGSYKCHHFQDYSPE
jgi:hypothetical protein